MKNFKEFLNNTLVVLCARGNSKGLKNKNIIKINNKPLIYFAINKIKKNNIIYRCISSDSRSIIKISKKNMVLIASLLDQKNYLVLMYRN